MGMPFPACAATRLASSCRSACCRRRLDERRLRSCRQLHNDAGSYDVDDGRERVGGLQCVDVRQAAGAAAALAALGRELDGRGRIRLAVSAAFVPFLPRGRVHGVRWVSVGVKIGV